MRDFYQFKELFIQNLLRPKPSILLVKWLGNGMLKKHFNRLHKSAAVKQDVAFHVDNVFLHCVKTCDATPPNVTLRWAGLLHDLGKVDTVATVLMCNRYWPRPRSVEFCPFKNKSCYPQCKSTIRRITFYRHEIVGERVALATMRKFQVKKPLQSNVVTLVGGHMYNYTSRWTDNGLARFVSKYGITHEDLKRPDEFPLFCLRIADRMSRGLEPVTPRQREFEERLRGFLE